ncbi:MULTISPECIES: Wzz/FepE/Etk N-terminal domain-containing protein [unclassified Salinivibrio]|uniref:Wzz/FepE/Etk N-terminal domain-containing protein n=1 Tax=unclassified Salinivibrio TaxID=2636825 RepID=UPI000987A8CD|nr:MULTISPECIES: Wzz/FepE/Etk N-terminal domain-containing protein [unclassified Salinivibrio]
MSDKQQPAQPQYVAPPYFQQPHDDEIDLRELFAALWQGKWWVIGLSMLCMLVAAAYAFTQPNVYSAQATISAVVDPYGLANKENERLVYVNQELEINLFSRSVTERLSALSGQPVNVTHEVARGEEVIKLSAEGTDPAKVYQQVTSVAQFANQAYKAHLSEKLKHSVDVLKAEIRDTSAATISASLSDYAAQQTYKLAMLNHPSTQLIQVVKPATEPTSPIKPKRKLITVLGFLLGGMLGVAIVLVRFAFKREDTE